MVRQREIVHYARFKELFEYYEKRLKNGNNTLTEPMKYTYNNDYYISNLNNYQNYM